MRRGIRRRVVVGMVAALAVAACSGADEATRTTPEAVEEEARVDGDTAADRAEGPAPGDAGDGGTAVDDSAATEAAGGDGAGEADGETTVEVGGETAGRDVIRRANLTLASDDPERTVDDVGAAAEEAGGFVSDTDLRRQGGVLAGTVTVRVPATSLSATLTRIEAAGTEVRSRSLSSEDVTGKLTDIAAQLRNLRALETQLLELLADARETGDTEEVLHVFDRIRGVRDEIERLEGRQETLDDLVALATITVHVEPTPALLAQTAPQRDPETEPWSPSRQVEVAWDTTLRALQGIADAVIVVAVTALPVALVVLLPLVVVALLLRTAWRRRPGGGDGPSGLTDRPAPPAGNAPGAPVPSAAPDRD